MKVKKIISGILLKLKSQNQKLYPFNLNGKNLKIVKGTLREVNDVDEVWYNLIANHSTNVFDIGCNIGRTALMALTCDNVKQVVMIDTNPQALSLANLNVIHNNFIHKTRSFLGFVSNKNDEQIDFYTVGHGAAGSMYKSHAETAASLGIFYKVQTVTLDYLVEYFNITPDFVKIDVEGAEFLVLNGAIKTVKSNPIKILVEMHSNKELSMLENTNNILNWCKEVGYAAWYLKDKEKLFNAETVKHRGRCHFLLIPEGENFPTYL